MGSATGPCFGRTDMLSVRPLQAPADRWAANLPPTHCGRQPARAHYILCFRFHDSRRVGPLLTIIEQTVEKWKPLTVTIRRDGCHAATRSAEVTTKGVAQIPSWHRRLRNAGCCPGHTDGRYGKGRRQHRLCHRDVDRGAGYVVTFDCSSSHDRARSHARTLVGHIAPG